MTHVAEAGKKIRVHWTRTLAKPSKKAKVGDKQQKTRFSAGLFP
jgi:hypothetical protein